MRPSIWLATVLATITGIQFRTFDLGNIDLYFLFGDLFQLFFQLINFLTPLPMIIPGLAYVL